VRSNQFGVVYVLDEPSAGLHPADTEALLAALDQLNRSSWNASPRACWGDGIVARIAKEENM
jgi:hypothetical protein